MARSSSITSAQSAAFAACARTNPAPKVTMNNTPANWVTNALKRIMVFPQSGLLGRDPNDGAAREAIDCPPRRRTTDSAAQIPKSIRKTSAHAPILPDVSHETLPFLLKLKRRTAKNAKNAKNAKKCRK
jgi:hypothetical protein